MLETRLLELMPPGEKHSIERGFFPALLERGDLVLGPVHEGYWIDIGTPGQYLQVHRDILEGRFRVALDGTPTRGGWIHPEATVSPDAILEAPFYIGRGCQVEAGARVGPDAVLVESVKVAAGAQVSDSVIWTGAAIGRTARSGAPSWVRRSGSAIGPASRGASSARARSSATTPARPEPGETRMTAIDTSIFKAYDIRGLYPEQIHAEVARASAAPSSTTWGRRIAVGRDCPPLLPRARRRLHRGRRCAGCDVIDIGVVATDVLYFSVARHELEAAGPS